VAAEHAHEGLGVGEVVGVLVVLRNRHHQLVPLAHAPLLEHLLLVDLRLAQRLQRELVDAQPQQFLLQSELGEQLG
jgi:hypothetical protein